MTKRPNKEDVEKVALEFAKELIDTSNGWMSAGVDDELMRRATSMAIDWLAGEELRSNIVEQHYPNWIDLSVKNKSLDIGMGEKRWFVAHRLDSENQNQAGLPEIVEAKISYINDQWHPIEIRVEDVIHAIDYRAIYFIPENSSKVFKQGFQPMPPQGVEVKNNKFSPTMSPRD